MAEAAAVAPKLERPSLEAEPRWAAVLGLPCDLTVDVPLPGFRVGDLTKLAPRMVIDSHWQVGEDVPVRVNGQLVAWGEFEVVSNRLAVRLTELR